MARLPKGKAVLPLPPFKAWLASNIPAVYDNTMTYYEELCALIKYLQSVVLPALNENAAAVTVISNAVEHLQKYVDDYFKNLDVQEEINNKLDEMAGDGTLDEILNNYDKLQFIAPKKISAQVSSFDANLILYRDKSIAIDVGYASVYQAIIDMYTAYNVASLDYVIITHWDTDHIGNLGQMVTNGVINENTTVYLPAEPSYVDATQVANVKATLTGANVTYITPTTGDTLEVGLLKMTFLNCDLATLEQYAGLPAAANLMSTILLIEHKDVKALYTGDADNEAFKNLYDNDLVNCQIDLFKISHHGFNVGTFQPFIKAISPKYALQTASLSRMTDATTSYCEQITLLNKLGTVIYPCGIQKDYIEFLSDGYELHVQQGEPLTVSTYANYKDVYVDISVNTYDYQDGTSDHPFKELEYAIAYMSNYSYTYVNFHLADGIYGVTQSSPSTRLGSIWISNLPYTVKLYGNSEDNTAVKIYGVLVENSNVTVDDMTIYCDYRQGVYAEDSNVHMHNVKFTTVSGTASSYSAIVSYRSNITIDESNIEYTNKLFTGNGSLVSLRTCNATNITTTPLIPTTGDNTFNIRNLNSNVTDYAPCWYNPPVLLFDGTQGAATLEGTLNGTFTDYEALEITLSVAGSRTVPISRVYYPRNAMKIPFEFSSKSSSSTYRFTGDITLSNDNKVTLGNLCKITYNRSTGNTVVEDVSTAGDFAIHDVRGIKTNMITAPSA